MKDSAMEGEKGFIGVDFDGTLAYYDGHYVPGKVGPPIPLMVRRVKRWLRMGKEVKIFTARASSANHVVDVPAIRRWCKKYIGVELEVTGIKDFRMLVFYDDRAIQVKHNTGILVRESSND